MPKENLTQITLSSFVPIASHFRNANVGVGKRFDQNPKMSILIDRDLSTRVGIGFIILLQPCFTAFEPYLTLDSQLRITEKASKIN
jgi:hypothetical protein